MNVTSPEITNSNYPTFPNVINEQRKQIEQYQKSLYALLNMAYETEADLMADIIINALTGNELMEHFEQDGVKGLKAYEELMEG